MDVRKAGIKELLETSHGTSCDKEIYEKGEAVAIIHGGSANLIERYVLELKELTGVGVDWHYMGGRGVIKTLPKNLEKVKKAIEDTKLVILTHW